MTTGCAGCIAANMGAPAVNHSDACRIRTEKLMSEDGHSRYMSLKEKRGSTAERVSRRNGGDYDGSDRSDGGDNGNEKISRYSPRGRTRQQRIYTSGR